LLGDHEVSPSNRGAITCRRLAWMLKYIFTIKIEWPQEMKTNYTCVIPQKPSNAIN
jgi:hypothetical protein